MGAFKESFKSELRQYTPLPTPPFFLLLLTSCTLLLVMASARGDALVDSQVVNRAQSNLYAKLLIMVTCLDNYLSM